MPFIIIGALLIGLTLGLMGSGGSILTVPVLVYVLGHDGKVAIAESLAIVGGIALVTMFPYARSHMVNWRNVLFGIDAGHIGIFGMKGDTAGHIDRQAAVQLRDDHLVGRIQAAIDDFFGEKIAGTLSCTVEQVDDALAERVLPPRRRAR